MAAGALMSLSSVTVIVNALFLRDIPLSPASPAPVRGGG
jgi:cation transport ATPase